MEEVETAPGLDPEEDIKKGGKRRRLACLIRPVDGVQIRFAVHPLAEIDALIGEFAVPGEVEALKTHQGSRASAPACSRASTSSTPSFTSSVTAALNAASSAPRRFRHSWGSWVLSSSAISTASA